MRYTTADLASKNISEEQLEANANLGDAAIQKKLKDYTVQMGGPIKTNKAFFFASVQRYSALSDPIGPVENSQDISPRINLKFTLQPTSRDTIILGTQYDQYNLTGRVGVLAGLAGDRPADGRGRRAGVGVERAVAPLVRNQRAVRGEVDRL